MPVMVTLERQAPRSLTFGASYEEKKQSERRLVSHGEKGELRSHIPSLPDSNQRGSPRRAPYPPHLQGVYKGLLRKDMLGCFYSHADTLCIHSTW